MIDTGTNNTFTKSENFEGKIKSSMSGIKKLIHILFNKTTPS